MFDSGPPGYHVIRAEHHELGIYYLTLQVVKLDVPSSNLAWVCDRAQAGPKDTRKLHEEVVLRSMVCTSVIMPYVLDHTPMALWDMPYDQVMEGMGSFADGSASSPDIILK